MRVTCPVLCKAGKPVEHSVSSSMARKGIEEAVATSACQTHPYFHCRTSQQRQTDYIVCICLCLKRTHTHTHTLSTDVHVFARRFNNCPPAQQVESMKFAQLPCFANFEISLKLFFSFLRLRVSGGMARKPSKWRHIEIQLEPLLVHHSQKLTSRRLHTKTHAVHEGELSFGSTW